MKLLQDRLLSLLEGLQEKSGAERSGGGAEAEHAERSGGGGPAVEALRPRMTSQPDTNMVGKREPSRKESRQSRLVFCNTVKTCCLDCKYINASKSNQARENQILLSSQGWL